MPRAQGERSWCVDVFSICGIPTPPRLQTEEQKGWTEETCDMTDAVREETLKEKRAAFEKEWKEKWEALVEEHKPSDAAEPRQLDQTLATFIGYLAQSNQVWGWDGGLCGLRVFRPLCVWRHHYTHYLPATDPAPHAAAPGGTAGP